MKKNIQFYLSKNLFPLINDQDSIPFENFIFKYTDCIETLQNELNTTTVDMVVLGGLDEDIYSCIEQAAKISQISGVGKIPIFAAVSNADKVSIQLAYENGVTKIFTPPIDKQGFYQRIRNYFNDFDGIPEAVQALVIDDNDHQRTIIVKILSRLGIESLTAINGKDAIDKYLFNTNISIIISDIYMPVMDGFETCKFFKSRETFKHVPILVLTSQGDVEVLKKILELGANDYINKPVNIDEFMARVKVQLRLKQYYDEIQRHISEEEKLNMMLMDLSSKLNDMAVTDYLTGIYNRRYTMEYLKTEAEKCNRYENCFSIILFDIDHFKKINDTYGHLGGDSVLVNLADIIKKTIRKSDVLGRIGGEEFICILSTTLLEGAKIFAEKLRSTVERIKTVYNDNEIMVTISLGVAQVNKDMGMDKLIQKADDALYLAKKNGRNRVEISPI